MSGTALYLALCAQGLALRLVDAPERPDGYGIKVRNLDRLETLARERARRQILAHRPQLVALLSSCAASAVAARQEAAARVTDKARRRLREHKVSTLAWV